eukprot:11533951-Heterocapsa_arctica.AAC.1
MAKNTSKNKEDLGSIPKFVNGDDKIALEAANAKTWSEYTRLHLARMEPVSVTLDGALMRARGASLTTTVASPTWMRPSRP